MNRNSERLDPNRLRTLLHLVFVGLSRNNLVGHLAGIVVISLFENAIRIHAVLLPSDDNAELADRLRDDHVPGFLGDLADHRLLGRFTRFDAAARKLVAFVLRDIIQKNLSVLHDDCA